MKFRRELYMRNLRLRPQNIEFTTLASEELRLRNLHARASSVNMKIVFAEHERMDLKSTI